jgi:hypothetical protein
MVKKMTVVIFNLKQLNEQEVMEQYQVTLKNKFAGLENLDDNRDINGKLLERTGISAKGSIGLCESNSYGLMRKV